MSEQNRKDSQEGDLSSERGQEPVRDPSGAQEPSSVDLPRGEYEELVRKSSEFDELRDRLLRSAADFDNAKKRLAKEREEFVKFALEGTICDLLPILDNFEWALEHLEAVDDKSKSIRDGFFLVQKQFVAVLTGRGLKRLETVGKPFDPQMHEAVGHIVSSNQPERLVLEEVLAGYQLNGKLLRPAKVKISTKEEAPSDEKSEELT